MECVYPIHWNISVNCVWKTQTLWNMGRRISGLWSLTFTWNHGTKTWGFASLPCGGNWLWWSDSNHKVLQVLFSDRMDSNWDFVFCVRNLRSLTIENCSFNIDESELNEENLYIKNMQVPMLLELRMFKVISIPLEMAMMILKKCLNIVNIEIDGEIDLTNEKVSELLQENNLAKLKHLMIYSSK